MKNFTIIFRVTNSCNLNCKYCYDKQNHMNMREENERFSLKMSSFVDNISSLWNDKNAKSEIIFHGGEPLIINADNYDRLMAKIKEIYPNAKFSMQTNATLLNEKNIKILKKYNVHIGISIDGFDEQTNHCRVYKNGKNSFDKIMQNIKLLKDNNVSFGIIMTLTNSAKGKEQEFYKFISENDLKCNIRPAFQCNQSNVDFMTNDDYFEFFQKIFDIWIKDENKTIKLTQIREIYDEFAKALQPNYRNKSCSVSGNCFKNFISLDTMGNLYSCNRTYNNPEFFYGNISEMEIEQLEKKINERIRERQQYLEKSKCKKCKIYDECKGGCPANSYSLHGRRDSVDDSFCTAKMKIKDYINEYLNENEIRKDYEEMRRNEEKLYK